MAHGFLTPQDVSGESPLFGKIAKWLQDQWEKERETTKKNKEEVSGKLDTLQKAVEVNVRDVTKRQAPSYKMLRGNQPKALPSGTKALPPGGPRLPGSPGGPKGSAITNFSGGGPSGISADAFFKRAQSGVGASGEYLTNAQRRDAFIKSRQEAVKTAAATNSPAISPDSGADIVAAVAKNTEAISTLVKVTKEQTSNDTKLSERSALTQEKLMGRQRAAAEERSLEQGKDLSGFMTPTMKKLEKQAKGGGGYDANMNRRNTASDLLDIGSDIMDTMGKGKVRRVTQGRDGRTSRQRLRDMRARRAGGGIKPRGKLGALSRLGGAASKGGALSGLGGGLKGAARGLGKSGPLALLTAGLEFGDRMSSGQNVFQAGAGTAGSVGGGLAGAAAGAAIGSIVPGVGTVIGGLIGGMLGSMAGGGTADMLTGANNIPSGAGGMLSSGPMSGYMSMLHGTELTLSGNNAKETKNIGEALGEGMIMASLGPLNPKVLELSAKGMKHYYEKMGGKDMLSGIFEGLGDIFKTGMQGIANLVHGLGGVLGSLGGGAAYAGTMPGGLTGGSTYTPGAQTKEQAGLLKAIRFAEGTEKSYGTIYGGNVVKELEEGKLTVQEVIDMADTGKLPQRLGGGTIPGYGSGSKATGAYQFMPFTLEGLIRDGDLKPDELFTPEVQDKAALALARKRGVDQQLLAMEGLSDNVLNKLAPEWASLPTLAGRSYYGQPVKTATQLRAKFAEGSNAFTAGGGMPGAGGKPTVVLAGGTNTYTNPNQAASEMKASILDLQQKGYNVVVVPPSTQGEYAAVGNAVRNAAIEAGATVETGMYDVNDDTRAYTHLLSGEADRIRKKYAGATILGDSNAVRISGVIQDVAGQRVTGASTADIRAMVGGMARATPTPGRTQMASGRPGIQMGAGPRAGATGIGATGQANVGGSGAIFPFPGMFHRTHAKGWRPETGSYHAGQDIVETQEGGRWRSDPRTPILAAHDGIVSQMQYNGQKDAYLAGVRIWHPALGKELRYLHMNPSVKPGQEVKRGQVIGSLVPIAGNGTADGNTHLHLEFYDKDAASVREDSNQLYDQLVSGSTKVKMDQIASAGSLAGPSSTPLSGSRMTGSRMTGANPLGAAPPNLFATGAAPVAASPAAANTGTGVMQASAQTSGPVFQQPVTVINNYNVAGQGGGGDVIPNTLGAGVSMDQMGLGSFSQLKIRSIG